MKFGGFVVFELVSPKIIKNENEIGLNFADASPRSKKTVLNHVQNRGHKEVSAPEKNLLTGTLSHYNRVSQIWRNRKLLQ